MVSILTHDSKLSSYWRALEVDEHTCAYSYIGSMNLKHENIIHIRTQ